MSNACLHVLPSNTLVEPAGIEPASWTLWVSPYYNNNFYTTIFITPCQSFSAIIHKTPLCVIVSLSAGFLKAYAYAHKNQGPYHPFLCGRLQEYHTEWQNLVRCYRQADLLHCLRLVAIGMQPWSPGALPPLVSLITSQRKVYYKMLLYASIQCCR